MFGRLSLVPREADGVRGEIGTLVGRKPKAKPAPEPAEVIKLYVRGQNGHLSVTDPAPISHVRGKGRGVPVFRGKCR